MANCTCRPDNKCPLHGWYKPNPDEINPNHPVTRTAHDHWHKIAAFLMWKLKQKCVTITLADVDKLTSEDMVIVLHDHADCMEVKLMPRAEGEKMAKEHGGLPA